jgi:DNA-binding MarR family transcriptional regulator
MPDSPPRGTLQTADDLRRATARLSRRLRRLRADHDVSAAKLAILGQLYRADAEMTAVDLARLENLQPQSLTRSIAELDERGLVTRRPDESDRRQILIKITTEGRELLARDAHAQTAWLAQAIDTALTGTEQGLLHLAVGLLERVAASK